MKKKLPIMVIPGYSRTTTIWERWDTQKPDGTIEE
jgi:hypothetical protein